MRQHNGIILVTEPILIVQYALGSTPETLPTIPSGDVGNQILQITLRSVDNDWEFRFGSSGDYFYMFGQDIMVLPLANRAALTSFQFKAVTTADMRIIYEA